MKNIVRAAALQVLLPLCGLSSFAMAQFPNSEVVYEIKEFSQDQRLAVGSDNRVSSQPRTGTAEQRFKFEKYGQRWAIKQADKDLYLTVKLDGKIETKAKNAKGSSGADNQLFTIQREGASDRFRFQESSNHEQIAIGGDGWLERSGNPSKSAQLFELFPDQTTASWDKLEIKGTSAKDLRVMSFNIRYGTASDGENRWDNRKFFVADTIKQFSPDLLGTQETLGFQKSFISSQLPGYTAFGVGREDGKQGGEMTALFFRTQRFTLQSSGHFWLSETPDRPGSKSWDSSLPRMCSWVKLIDKENPTEKPILFVNTHFDHRGKLARLESVKVIKTKLEELGPGCDLILTGDFNVNADAQAGDDRDTYAELFAPGPLQLVDTYTATDSPSGFTTFSGFRGGITQGRRIDWIAVSESFKVHQAAIDRTQRDGKTPSDHYPVITILGQTQ